MEGAIVDLSDAFEMLRKRLEELCRTVPEQEEVDQVWSSIHKMEVRANEQAMKMMTLEGKLKQWQQEYDPRRYISEEFEFENGKMGAEEEEEEEAQEEKEKNGASACKAIVATKNLVERPLPVRRLSRGRSAKLH